AVQGERGCRNRRLGDRVGEVEVLAVEAARLEVVAQEPRRAPVRDGGGGAVLEEGVLRPGEEEAAVRRDCGRLEGEVVADATGMVGGRQERSRNGQRAGQPALEDVEALER